MIVDDTNFNNVELLPLLDEGFQGDSNVMGGRYAVGSFSFHGIPIDPDTDANSQSDFEPVAQAVCRVK